MIVQLVTRQSCEAEVNSAQLFLAARPVHNKRATMGMEARATCENRRPGPWLRA